MPEASGRVPDRELLARYVTHASRVRADGTVKHDAWMPPRDLELSVTRHAGLSQTDLWRLGGDVVRIAGGVLVGRADITAAAVRGGQGHGLDVVEAPLPENPQHAHVIGWPSDKPGQMEIAKRLAAASRFVRNPTMAAQ
jgi:hypothetical protein